MPAVAPRVLVVTNMWPGPADPSFGVFVAEQVADLRALGVGVETLFIDGRPGRLAYLRAIPRLRARLREPFSLVHAHYHLSGWVALLAGARPGRPLVVTHHGIEVFDGWQARPARWVTLLASRSLVISAAMARHLGLSEEGDVLPCGVDLERFAPRDRAIACRALGLDPARRRVAWVGADRPEKRLALARSAVARLATSRPAVDLHVVMGRPHDEVPDHLAACDALVVTSTREGGPLVVKEALAMGLPVVSTDVGDVAEVMAGVPGCAVVPAGAPDLAGALASALGEALEARPGEAAVARAARYDRRRVARRLVAIYAEVLACAS